ncbi:MAG: 2,3-bisphosphoglycerate-independent phosphoglycerate mutase [Candidatus Mcinerneyibacterium aminivorans]|uniref:2,3-bisphosphoglycerate-independent phosphoglycerate mutase n=1 Tax=Candidatus Mcinerneyibacterium aminivorans TaxID=2703815 RepID=A0A5D0MFY3_9BACT|nr:MAG: 2,3-bisphosphoglycerate-independent phosphoglycerate mutase [Candidatus Mcinerneyibacterium aminivorans]
MKKPVALIIRDGWGYSKRKKYNAIEYADPKNHKHYIENYPTRLIHTSGIHVGLPEGNQGSSEVGHLNLGAGRIVYQSLVRINKAVSSKKFYKNRSILNGIEHIKKNDGNIHIFGLVQDQGVHAHTRHLLAYLKFFKKENIPSEKVFIHVISDGRDTPPKSAEKYVEKIKDFQKKENYSQIASITGRYYAMDRDNRWDRTQKFYDLLTIGKSKYDEFQSIDDAIEDAYKNEETDEFILPRKTKNFQNVKNDDLMVFFNYRFDRARQITKAFVERDFDKFETTELNNVFFLATTEYYKELPDAKNANVEIAYPLVKMNNLLGKVLEKNCLTQLRIAETEKFAHVTFFFNGQQDIIFNGEDRILIDSPKISTYDKKPEMSAYEVTEKVLSALDSDKYDVIILNYANPDMVGHTGDFDATVKAIKTVDECVGKVVDKILGKDGVILLTADHGNAEKMRDFETNEPQTAHTSNPVPLSIISKRPELQKDKIKIIKDGKLADIAPTMLKILDIDIPEEMTGNIIFKNK